MKNRKGFTLIEIIFVIAILGILVVIATPATIGIVKSSKVKIMKINENEVADASKIFANDYYFNPISKEYKEKKDEVFPLVRINNNYYRYVCLNTLKENKYLENDIKYADEIDCDGLVYYEFKRENELDKIFVATHTNDAYHKAVSQYTYEDIRFLHIKDIRIY